MIRRCEDREFDAVLAVINEGAEAYRGVIPDDRWADPYMTAQKLRSEIGDGVVFWGAEREGELVAVMGIQSVLDVTLIRHAYVRTGFQKLGLGSALLKFLRETTARPVLIGTWNDATWAIRFYERHGFTAVGFAEKERLLRRYWQVPERQIATSTVLADGRWLAGTAKVAT